MQYIILNKLFKWDYIYWSNRADCGIARILKLPDGSIGYWRYKNIHVLDIITSKDQVIWLTCLPSKYFLHLL